MSTNDLSERTPEELRVEIEKTRAKLADKAARLEQELHDAGDEVKETVREKLESAREALSLDYHMDRHPWGVIALAVVAGAAANRALLQPAGKPEPNKVRTGAYYPAAQEISASKSPEPGLLQHLIHTFEPEIHEIREQILRSGMELVQDFARQTLPTTIAKYFRAPGRRSSTNFSARRFSHEGTEHFPRDHYNGEVKEKVAQYEGF